MKWKESVWIIPFGLICEQKNELRCPMSSKWAQKVYVNRKHITHLNRVDLGRTKMVFQLSF